MVLRLFGWGEDTVGSMVRCGGDSIEMGWDGLGWGQCWSMVSSLDHTGMGNGVENPSMNMGWNDVRP